MQPGLEKYSVKELLALYADIVTNLCARNVVRSVNNPAADYAEYLIGKALKLKPAPPSTKGYDLIGKTGEKYEVKARRYTSRSKPTRFSPIRQIEENHFNYLAVVLFEENFDVKRAIIFPLQLIKEIAYWQNHVNGWIVPINDQLLNSKSGRDITTKLRKIHAEA